MSREALILLVVTVALFGGLAGWAVVGEARAQDAGLDQLAAVEARIDALAASVSAARVEAAQTGDRASAELAVLAGRVEQLERRSDGPAFGDVARLATAAPAPEAQAAGGAADGPDEALREEFASLLALGILDESGSRASPEEEARFWELARTTGLLGEVLAGLEARIAADPGNLALRMELADGYVTRLLTVPSGPERGVWGTKAENQWKEIIARDPEHWEAPFRLGVNYSYYPSFLGKQGEAIANLESARELQQRSAPEPRHVQTYLVLARLYQGQGDVARAREVLDDGLRHHPGDARLESALDALD